MTLVANVSWSRPSSRPAPLSLASRPAWPITALLVGYPLWWALGIADFMWIVLAVPMTLRMVRWRLYRTRRLRVPPGFGLWALFLVCSLAGVAVIGLAAPGTVQSSVSSRLLSYLLHSTSYLGITVLLLYVGNLTEHELPRRRLAWMLGLVAIYATVGGVAGMLRPQLQFSSPLQLLLPQRLQSNAFIHAMTHPGLSQVQNVLGGANARPKAPFDYTNTWGDCLTLLLPWLVVGWWKPGNRRAQLLVALVVVVAAVPLLYSLNRGAWVGAALSIVFLVVALVARRPRALVAIVAAAVVLTGVLAAATPVSSIVAQRIAHPHSNKLRGSLDTTAITDALSSPLIGYGDTRKQIGSPRSIALGPTPKCPICGQQEVGGTGQLWFLLICSGVLGAGLYAGFFVFAIWRFRRDHSPYAQAGILTLLLSLIYLFTYVAIPAPLGFTMLAYALMWRNGLESKDGNSAPALRRWEARRPAVRAPAPV